MLYEHNKLLADQLLKTQRKSLQSYIAYTLIILFLASLLYVCGQLISNKEILFAINVTSTFVSSLSGLSIKEIIDKKRTLELVQSIKFNVEKNQSDTTEQEIIKTTLQTLMTVML
jgi:hypothetical protein